MLPTYGHGHGDPSRAHAPVQARRRRTQRRRRRNGASAGAANRAPLATFTQTGGESGAPGFTPPTGQAFRVSYAGAATLAPGTYYASVQGSDHLNVWGGAGTSTATWAWGPTTTVGVSANVYPYYFTINAGSTWIASGNAAAPMITLADTGTALSSGSGSSGPPSSSGSDSALAGPSSVLQQVRAPKSGACGDVDDSGLGMGTGITGGWSASWAEWANGSICTRTMTYVNEAWRLQ